MLYLTMHSTHFDLWLRLYDLVHMVKSSTTKDRSHPTIRRCSTTEFCAIQMVTIFWVFLYLYTKNKVLIFSARFYIHLVLKKEGNVLFNNAPNTFWFMVIWQTYCKGRKEMIYLTTHPTHFDSWLYGRHIVKEGNYLTMHPTHFYSWLYGRHIVNDGRKWFI